MKDNKISWYSEVEINISCCFIAANKELAIEELRRMFKKDFNIYLDDHKIIRLEKEEEEK